MDTLIRIAQVILCLSILVTLHECGHFFPARWFKTKVDKFYLFFDPWFSLFSFKRGDTEYGIGWLPLGGYVKIAGMIDESMDKEQMEGPVQPWEFRAKPAWQRLIIMLGGVIVNFVLGFFLLGMIFWVWGESYIPNDQIVEGIYVDSLGYEMGLRDGDKILKVGDADFEKFSKGTLVKAVVIDQADNMLVNRAGKKVTLPILPEYTNKLAGSEGKNMELFGARQMAIVDSILAESTPDMMGFKKGDQIISFNNQSIQYKHEYEKTLYENFEKNINLGVIRNNSDTINISYTLPVKPDYKSGMGWKSDIIPNIESYSFTEAFPLGYRKGVAFLGDQITAFKLMFQGKLDHKESVGSVISIGKMFPPTWDWKQFWYMTAILSLILAVMNLLPIPALDGGHVIFLLFEWITGIKPNDKFMEYATTAGFFILMALMIYVLGLDISKLF